MKPTLRTLILTLGAFLLLAGMSAFAG